MNLLELPDCVLDEIFQYLSYDDIAKKRLVSTKVNRICQSLLNRGVVKLKSRIAAEVETLKPLIPRKQSERWNHPAAERIRNLDSVAASVGLLSIIYRPYMDLNLCCYMPGKVIDTSLDLLRRGNNLERKKVVVQFNDEICMAREHFQEQIEPTLKKLKAQIDTAWIDKIQKLQDTAKQLLVATTESSVATTMDEKQNSKKCQCQHRGNCRNIGVDNKYKAIMKKLTNSRKEIADLRRRLEKCESQNRSAAGEQTEENHLVRKTDIKKVRRSSKRLEEAKKRLITNGRLFKNKNNSKTI